VPELITGPTTGAKVGFGLLLVVAVGLVGYIIWPFRAPLFLAAVLAAVCAPLFEGLTRLLHGRGRLAAALLTLAVLAVIVAPFVSVVSFAVQQVIAGLGYVRDQLGVHSVSELRHANLPPPAAHVVDRTLEALHLSREQLQSMATNYMGEAERGTAQLLQASTRFALHTVIMLIAFYFFSLERRTLIDWLSSVSPLQARQTRMLLGEFRKVSSASLVGAAATALFQGISATIGFLITHVPHPVFFGLMCAMCSFVPIIGTALVWVPAVLLLALSGHHAAAVVLLAWSLVFIVAAEHLAKPIILQGQVEMHTGLVFLALLGGIEEFGLMGIIVGPLIVSFFLALLRMYQLDFAATQSAPPSPSGSIS
jgi:predicted PurR-regulated permease PerM